uniref:NADH-ubiquinone oxidoreductase chain 1 n=1 Tax=Flustrellidra hispida TaxID=97271 RepID=Q15K54_9BILA|nr:NADH dehydrogenase subunit 1 [Flustrellidra hispida]AAZ76748.1 NADH dehydrogenase subunit 1 [Flustrellidra hispida]
MKGAILSVVVALGVGFYTLLERKTLSYMQSRKGPNKPGLSGMVQPLSDAIKLFTKEKTNMFYTSTLFALVPVLFMSLIFTTWWFYFCNLTSVYICLGAILLICLSSLSVYGIFFSGWTSNSKYALMGSMRGLAQTISYEVCMSILILIAILSLYTADFASMTLPVGLHNPLLLAMWTICIPAETNRTPFDHAEGESELVSGFNTEYSGGLFSFLFIAEYGSVILMSMITSILFFSSYTLFFYLYMFMFLWLRATEPRMRYDTLMMTAWKTLLALSLCWGLTWV